jgi:Ca2+-binding RTX toxin-like protein
VGGGNDTVLAFEGHDTVYAGSGADTIYGYDGNDTIYGGSGNDVLYGGGDADALFGESGADRMNGEGGNDDIFGGTGADRLRGGDGADTINGGSGADVIEWQAGDSGADTISGFNLAEDRLWFGAGYFNVEPVGAVDLSDVLTFFDAGPHALLAANTADQGWTVIATLNNVDAYALGQMIENETILAPAAVALGGGPGDFGLL